MKNTLLIFFLAGIFGCQIPDQGVIESSAPPFLSQATVVPSSLNVNEVANLPMDPIDTTIELSVAVSGAVNSTMVTYSLLNPTGSILVAGTLLDNGKSPDATPGDGFFSGIARLHILKQDVGGYTIEFRASDDMGFESNTATKTLEVKNSANHAPRISSLVMQDTALVPPPNETTFVRITLVVSDSEGLGDIVSVKLNSRKPSGASAGQFFLYDDGGSVLYSQFGLPFASGDAVAGDGIFTITIPLAKAPDPPDAPPTYRDFAFTATDRSGESSNMITKRIFIIP